MNTKNIAFLGLGLFAAVALASCDKIEESTAKPITNPQEPIFSSESLKISPFVHIDAINPAAGAVKFASYKISGIPQGYTLSGTLQLSQTADFAKVIESPITSDGIFLMVDPATLDDQYAADITKSPDITTLYGRAIIYAENGTDRVRLGGMDTYFAEQEYQFTPVAPEYYISPAYYLVKGDGSKWDYTSVVEFSHAEGVSRYDDPNFTTLLTRNSAAGDRWIVMPVETFTAVMSGKELAGNEYYVPVYDRTDAGTVYGDLDAQTSGSFDGAALPALDIPCQLEINALTKTYSMKAAVEKYYATGNGWSNWGEHWMPLFTTNFVDYNGFLNLGTEFKFAPQAGWGGDFGASAALAETDNNGIYSYSGLVKDSGDNIRIGHEGLYFAYLSASTWNVSLQQVKTWGLIGDFNGWGGDIVMTPSDDLYTWTADLTVEGGQGWKFRANSDWAVNLGGTANALWNNGDNIVLPEAGTYTITLDLTTYPATFTAVKK